MKAGRFMHPNRPRRPRPATDVTLVTFGGHLEIYFYPITRTFTRMKKNMLRNGFVAIGMAVGLSGALASCGSSTEAGQQTEKAAATRAEDVDVAGFAALMESLDNPILLDVRSDGEWAEGHLPNASYIPFQAPDFADQLAALDKSRPVLVYCASGGRSSRAMNMLNQSGQTEVYNLLGGIRAWSAAGQPVVNGEPQPIQ